MVTGLLIVVGWIVIGGGVLGWVVYRHVRNQARESAALHAQEFRTGYADLLPDFHPANVLEYVLAEHGRGARKPPFATRRAGDFSFEKTAQGGQLRVGAGCFEVRLDDPAMLKLHYVDDAREYWWARTLEHGEHIQWKRGPNAGISEESPAR